MERVVILILYYLGFMVLGDIVAYLIGLFIEYEWGSNVSMLAFLVLYFVSLWTAWKLSVWMTEPKKQTA
jgi:hypothetical protein